MNELDAARKLMAGMASMRQEVNRVLQAAEDLGNVAISNDPESRARLKQSCREIQAGLKVAVEANIQSILDWLTKNDDSALDLLIDWVAAQVASRSFGLRKPPAS